MRSVDLVVIGGGPAGLAAAAEARACGAENIVILERDSELGGILQQCIHNGFGLHIFNEELTGPEYAERFIEKVREKGIEYKLDTMVLSISRDRVVTAVSSAEGLISLKAEAVILAMGCRERTRGGLNIPGVRPAGVFTAGTAQRYVNMEGYLPGKKIVILGSGDIGLIMARRMTLEGAEVKMVCELMPYSSGLTRNIVQCLEDYGIPLKLSHTVVQVHGRDRVEGVTIARVDGNRKPVPGSFEYVECDTLLLSVGLIPENELSRELGISLDPVTQGPVVNESMETSEAGVFACGNVVHVHDLVDNVTEESMLAGRCAARYIKDKASHTLEQQIKTRAGSGVRYVVPHMIRPGMLQPESKLLFRVSDVFRNISVKLVSGGEVIYSKKKVKAAPGEMESIKLTPGLVAKAKKNGEITVQLEEA